MRAEFPGATHHCWAWCHDADATRSSDDGEPSGTAGRPILQAITSRELRHTEVIVVRWYGGTKLGTGGLVRAYAAAANAVLDAAQTERWVPTRTLHIRFAYTDQGAVDAVLHRFEAEELDARYGTEAERVLRVEEAQASALVSSLIERTGGRIVVE